MENNHLDTRNISKFHNHVKTLKITHDQNPNQDQDRKAIKNYLKIVAKVKFRQIQQTLE
jgi:hypothetical protein